jgi:site-specific DNA recombinase
MSLVGGTSYGCSTAGNKGTCANRRTIKRRELEAMVLEGLKAQLMAPEAVKEFAAGRALKLLSLQDFLPQMSLR